MATTPTAGAPTRLPAESLFDQELDRIRAQRSKLKDRHATALSALMTERDDLRGVSAMADLVDDAVRWSA